MTCRLIEMAEGVGQCSPYEAPWGSMKFGEKVNDVAGNVCWPCLGFEIRRGLLRAQLRRPCLFGFRPFLEPVHLLAGAYTRLVPSLT